MSFLQALTESLKAVPTAILLASLPESIPEAGGERGVVTLRSIEHIFGRTEALWKPVAVEEAFEIVRRRLFNTIPDQVNLEETCRGYADLYISNKNDFPEETQETRYFERLKQSYPIHPEVFDRLYEDWSCLDNFQRTRGVLQLMAKVIHKLWTDGNTEPLIMPASIPLADANIQNEVIKYLSQGWNPVLTKDVDGSNSEPVLIERAEPRFGQAQVCRRLTRTIFLGSAPHAAALSTSRTSRGIDLKRILLGVAQPGQVLGVYIDAMKRLIDRLHYLNSADNRLFWFDTSPNLRREMEDRKRRFNDKDDVVPVIKDQLQRLLSNGCFDGIHIFTRSDDIPDDYSLRLVILPPDAYYQRSGVSLAIGGTPNSDGAKKILTTRGEQPRLKQNRLIFLAADGDVIGRLKDHVLTLLAWESINKDIQVLNLDQYQNRQAKTGFEDAKKSLDRIVKETYKWLLVPEQDKVPGDKFEHFTINPSVPSIVEEVERILKENEHLITGWAPIHLHNLLKKWFWKEDVKEVRAKDVWHSTCCYLYLPRLKNENTFSNAINAGAESRDFFGLAYGKEGDEYIGFSYGKPMTPVFDSSLLLIDSLWAAEYQSKKVVIVDPPDDPQPGTGGTATGSTTGGSGTTPPGSGSSGTTPPTPKPVQYKKRFYGRVNLKPTRAKADFATIVEEIVLHLINNPTVTASIKIEIEADCLEGFDEATQRTIKENCNTLKFDLSEFE
jgi:hypothetical protein